MYLPTCTYLHVRVYLSYFILFNFFLLQRGPLRIFFTMYQFDAEATDATSPPEEVSGSPSTSEQRQFKITDDVTITELSAEPPTTTSSVDEANNETAKQPEIPATGELLRVPPASDNSNNESVSNNNNTIDNVPEYNDSEMVPAAATTAAATTAVSIAATTATSAVTNDDNENTK